MGGTADSVCRGCDKRIFEPSSIAQFECLSCGLVAEKPYQAPCGHRYCAVYAQSLSRETKCLDKDCDEKFRKEDLFEDKAANRDILRLTCCCRTSTDCPWRGPFGKLPQHEETCEYKSYTCPRCDEKILMKAKQEHEQSCDKVPCKFRDVGCKEKMSRDKSRDHDRAAVVVHLDLMLMALDSLLRHGALSVDFLQGAADDKELSEAAAKALTHDTVADRQIQERLRALLESLNQAIPLSKRDADIMQAIVHDELPVVHEQKLRLLRRIEELGRMSHKADKEEQDLQERIKNLQLATYNGTCLFKIDNFHERRRQAIAGNQIKMYSQYFFTSPRGYKLRLVCYLNGDGSGKDTHVSLFIIICKNRYDALLSWPFKYRVNLLCLTQDNSPPLKQSFTPDEGSSSFKRPDADFNVATGCPKFVELKKLAPPSPYLKDDTLIFKCVIDVPSDAD